MGIIISLLMIGVIGYNEIRESMDMAGDKGVSREYRDALNVGMEVKGGKRRPVSP